jgi:hypothetical protein
VVGDLTLNYETMPLTPDPGLTLTALSAPAGSADDDALRLLSSWQPHARCSRWSR